MIDKGLFALIRNIERSLYAGRNTDAIAEVAMFAAAAAVVLHPVHRQTFNEKDLDELAVAVSRFLIAETNAITMRNANDAMGGR